MSVYSGFGIMHLLIEGSEAQIAVGLLAATLVGFSKTGVPGTGILVVPMMAWVFGGRASVGALLPMLICADIFAVLWYRQHCRWDKLMKLIPWVVCGLLAGGYVLILTGQKPGATDPLNRVIGILVLCMMGLHLLRMKLGDRIKPESSVGVALTGAVAGFSTTVSNAAGPVMSIYLTSTGLPKEELVGTQAWYFFIFNLSKIPIYIVVGMLSVGPPMISFDSLRFDAWMIPAIILGAFGGKLFLPHIRQKSFDVVILSLATIAAIKLILS